MYDHVSRCRTSHETPNAALQRPGDNYASDKVFDESDGHRSTAISLTYHVGSKYTSASFMNVLLKVYEGLVGIGVTISLTITLVLGREAAGLSGMATGFVASVGIIGALWITGSPEPSSKIFRLIGLLMAAMCAVGVYWGGWRLGWLYGLVGWLGGLAIYFVLTRVTRFG